MMSGRQERDHSERHTLSRLQFTRKIQGANNIGGDDGCKLQKSSHLCFVAVDEMAGI